jgi:hypothetical protein
MTRDNVIRAIEEGIPFVIRMADGREYEVRDKYQIAVGKTTAVVTDTEGLPSLLPLLTVTGISYLAQNGAKK